MKKALALLLAALMLSGTVTTGLAADAADSEALDYIPGDIDGDGDVMINDAVLLFRNTMAPDLYPVSYAGDMDFTLDENVDIYDALRLFQHSMLPEEYPLFLTYNLTENGEAKSHVVYFEGADIMEQTAAEEVAYHINLVSGADVAVTNTIGDDSIPVIIATPDSYPELENLFPEDLAWLRTLTEETADGVRNWGDDGFAVRSLDGKIYIFGATPKGAMNGAYDFIEENTSVFWARPNNDLGLIYDEEPTVTVTKTNYREKSPFQVRGWTFANNTDNCKFSQFKFTSFNVGTSDPGIYSFTTGHNVKEMVYHSPIYDPECTEYWNTDGYGNPLTYEDSMQVNFWSDKAAEATAATLIAYVKEGTVVPELAVVDNLGLFVGMEDNSTGYNLPYSREPFEYAPGQFVDPAKNKTLFLTTVYFSYINKIARLVAEECPGTNIVTFAYSFSEKAPLCEIEDNVIIMFAPLSEDLRFSMFDENCRINKTIYNRLEEWAEISNNLVIYNYYGCFYSADRYSRPIWDNIKEHLMYYAENGFYGVQPEGGADTAGHYWWSYSYYGDYLLPDMDVVPCTDIWDMNCMIWWIYAKLSWNPYEDVDALIVEFCDNYYGGASEYMQEYYRLIEQGWIEGRDDLKGNYDWFTKFESYMEAFLFNPNFDEPLFEKILETLNKAWDAANDAEKERIRNLKETMEENLEMYLLSKEPLPEESAS